MKKKTVGISALFLFIGLFVAASSFAGQVVTRELTQWASQAIANEQSLPAISAPRSIAVLYFQNMSGNPEYDPLQKGLSVMLTTDLAKIDGLKVVERPRLQALLEEIELGKTGLVDIDTAPRVGRLLGARFLSGGDIAKGGVTQLAVEPSLLDVADKTMFSQATAEGNLNDLIAIEKEILFETVRLMNIKLTPAQKAELEKPMSASVAALLLFFKGIDASDHGMYTQAAELYSQALSRDPNLVPAREALNEISSLGLTSETTPTQEGAVETAPAKSGGFVKGAAIVLGIGAVAAGGYFAATSLSDSGDDSEPESSHVTPPTPAPVPQVVEVFPENGSTLACNDLDYGETKIETIKFRFSEPMKRSVKGEITVVPSDPLSISDSYWQDEYIFVAEYITHSYENENNVTFFCSDDPYKFLQDITLTLERFESQAGVFSGSESFQFRLRISSYSNELY